jgi:hypothetical protein
MLPLARNEALTFPVVIFRASAMDLLSVVIVAPVSRRSVVDTVLFPYPMVTGTRI